MATLPNGFDWADGLEGREGTSTPSYARAAQVTGGLTDVADMPIQEQPDSPEIERAEQATVQHRFILPWEEAKNRITLLGRGTLLYDSYENVTKVLSSRIVRKKMQTAELAVTAESVSFDSPPDDFQIVPVELGVNIIKHPRYFYAFLGDGQGSATEKKNQMVIRMLQNYFENTNAQYRTELARLMKASLDTEGTVGQKDPIYTVNEDGSGNWNGLLISGTNMAKRAALEIIQKYWRNEETPYLTGWQITWSAYYFRPQYLNPGGYVEDPIADAAPQLPDYFWSPAYPPDANAIWDRLHVFNPQSYSTTGLRSGATSISWLRKADELEYQRTWFKVTRTWIGSPIGFWDAELYNQDERPIQEDDFLEIDVEAM